MKKLMMGIVTLLAGSQVQARTIETAMRADLPNVQMQDGTRLAQRQIHTGRVEVDPLTKMITLQLFPEFRCPTGMLCAMVMPSPLIYTVTLDSAVQGNCNETVYSGTLDRREVDGMLEVITVVDNRSNNCEAAFLAGTEVVLNLQGPRAKTAEQHTLSGDLMDY